VDLTPSRSGSIRSLDVSPACGPRLTCSGTSQSFPVTPGFAVTFPISWLALLVVVVLGGASRAPGRTMLGHAGRWLPSMALGETSPNGTEPKGH
jgi:hypothetical protein